MIQMSVDDKTVEPSGLAGRVRASPYYPALSHPVVRRLLPGVSTSALGDGMSAVAIAWLALNLAPPASRGLWVGAAVAAYTLPGALGAVLFGRWLGRSSGSRIAAVDAALRAAVLGLTGCLALAGALGSAGFVALLGVSSLFSAWGVAGRYTLIAELLPAEHRIAGNTIFGLTDQAAITIGPALAGLIAAAAGPAIVIAIDAVTWAVLALSYQRVGPLARPARSPEVPGPDRPDRAGAWALIQSAPVLPGLLALSFLFYLLYGPVEVALPVHVAADLHGSAALLGTFWMIFGVGAIAGELAAPYLRRLPTWPTMTAIVLGWGVALLPLGLRTPLWLALAAFCVGAVIWGPWTSLSMAVFQEVALPGVLAPVLAARSALLTIATPLGTACGGPMIAALGARGALLVSALTTIVLGLVTTAVLICQRRRYPGRREPRVCAYGALRRRQGGHGRPLSSPGWRVGGFAYIGVAGQALGSAVGGIFRSLLMARPGGGHQLPNGPGAGCGTTTGVPVRWPLGAGCRAARRYAGGREGEHLRRLAGRLRPPH